MVEKVKVVEEETDGERLDFSDLNLEEILVREILEKKKTSEKREDEEPLCFEDLTNLYNRITTEKQGGVSCLISGGSGSGKTTFVLHVLDDLFTQGEELIFWRGQGIDQWHNAKAEFLIFHHAKNKLEFEDAKIKQYYELVKYKSIGEIFAKAKKGMVNVVYAPYSDQNGEYHDKNIQDVFNEYSKRVVKVKYAFWYSFLYELVKLSNVSVFFEGLENIAERGCRGLRFYLIGTLANALSYFRQRKISLYATTCRIADIDVRITDRMAFHIYMAKARVYRDSILNANRVKKAKIGKAFIEDRRSGDFLIVEFPYREISSLAVKLEETRKAEILKELYGEK